MIIKFIAGPLIGAVIGYFTNLIAVKMMFHPKKEVKVFGHKLPLTPGAIPKGKSRLAKSVGAAVGNDLITQADIENKLLDDELADKIGDMIVDKLSISVNDLFSGLPDTTEEDADSRKREFSYSIAKYIAEAVSQADISGIIVQKAPDVIKSKINNPMISMFLTNELLQSVLAPVGTEIQSYITENGEEVIAPYIEQKLADSGEKPLTDIIEEFGIDREQLKKTVVSLYKKAVSGCGENLMNWLNLSSIVEDKINDMDVDELEALMMSVMKKEFNTIVNLGALIGFILGLLNIFF